ncbi:MAG: tRNA pseudouridine(38-40) synthase TruA, partial [Proteobacteria bacterium]|nr:tRNA pseudouridine(38-40) synthase TruA [Pseudomonadota bacterium]
SKTPVRRLDRIQVRRAGEQLCIEIRANGFLHHMVRNIVGTLLALPETQALPQVLREILAGRDRRRAGPTAPACGLYFWQADYPVRFAIPPTFAATPLLGL